MKTKEELLDSIYSDQSIESMTSDETELYHKGKLAARIILKNIKERPNDWSLIEQNFTDYIDFHNSEFDDILKLGNEFSRIYDSIIVPIIMSKSTRVFHPWDISAAKHYYSLRILERIYVRVYYFLDYESRTEVDEMKVNRFMWIWAIHSSIYVTI